MKKLTVATGALVLCSAAYGGEMTPGTKIPIEVTAINDPATGRRVERIAPPGAKTVLPYYTRELFTADNRGVLVVSDRTGKLLPYIIYPDDGYMVCVSSTPVFSISSPAIGADRVVYVSENGVLGYAPVSGGAFVGVVELPRDFSYTEPGVSVCGRYAAVVYSEKGGPRSRNLLGGAPGEYPSAGSERTVFGLRALLLWADLGTGKTKGITGGSLMSHPMISPVDPCRMEYCNYGHWTQQQRMMTARFHEAANYLEVKPVFEQRLGLDGVGHEIFLADGRVAAIWMEYARIGDDADRPQKSYILVVDPVTGEHAAYDTPGMRYNHLHGRDGMVFVSEGLSEVLRPNEPPLPKRDTSAHGDLLVKYVVAGSRTVPTVLCALEGTNRQHAHPVLDRENRWAVFNDARDEHVSVYRVPVE